MNSLRTFSLKYYALYGFISILNLTNLIQIQAYTIIPPTVTKTSQILNAIDFMCLCNMAEQFEDNPWSSPLDNALQRLSLRTSLQQQKMWMLLRSAQLDTVLRSILDMNDDLKNADSSYLPPPSTDLAHKDLMTDMDIMCLENQIKYVINNNEDVNIRHENYQEALRNRILQEKGIIMSRIRILERVWFKMPWSNSERDISTEDVESLMESIHETLNHDVTKSHDNVVVVEATLKID
jgi:hypothetical protein